MSRTDMGQIVSLVKSILGFATKVKQEVDRERNRELAKAAERLAHPIKPPEYWPNLYSREIHCNTGPYSVRGIRKTLKNVILPVGYSEEQLTKVGFGPEVKEYQAAVDSERQDIYHGYATSLTTLADAVESELNGEDEKLKRALYSTGVNEKVVQQNRDLAAKAEKGDLTAAAINSSIASLKNMLDKAQLSQDVQQKVEEADQKVVEAGEKRSASVLSLVRRAIAPTRVQLPVGSTPA